MPDLCGTSHRCGFTVARKKGICLAMRSHRVRGRKSNRVLVRGALVTEYVTRKEFEDHLANDHDNAFEVTAPGYAVKARGRYALGMAVLFVVSLGLWLLLR